jgi:hypothetical protein
MTKWIVIAKKIEKGLNDGRASYASYYQNEDGLVYMKPSVDDENETIFTADGFYTDRWM